MSALSIQNRVEYIILGIAVTAFFGWIAYLLVQEGSNPAGLAALIIGLTGIGIGRQLIFFPPDISLGRWWKKYSMPATVGSYEGKSVLERHWDKFFIEIFDRDGYLIGMRKHEFDFGEYPSTYTGDLELIFRSVNNFQKYRLSWLARLRSPKIVENQIAEVINRDNAVVGHTTFSER